LIIDFQMMPNAEGGVSQVQMQQMQPTFTFSDGNNTNALQTITNLNGAHIVDTQQHQQQQQPQSASGNNTPSNFDEEDDGDEEPFYVNAKQYNRIMKRRQARAKLENDGRIPKDRKV
jgi:hypothetical protein